MKLLSQYSLFILLFALIGCDSTTIQYPSVLLEADSLAMVNPEAALAMLDSLSPSMFDAQEPVRRYHSLLSIKARDKAFLPHKSDSLVLDLLDYYEKKGDAHLLPEAYYYAGRVTRDLGDAPQALDYFQKALDEIDKTNYSDKTLIRLKSVVCSQMGYLLRAQHLHNNALKYIREAFVCDSLLKDTISMSIEMRDIAQILQHEQQYQASFSANDSAKVWSMTQRDTAGYYKALCQEVFTLFKIGEYAKADSLFQNSPHKIDKRFESMSDVIKGYLFAIKQENDSARFYYQKVLSGGTMSQILQANLWLAKDALQQGNLERATTFLSAQIAVADSVSKQDGAETVGLISSLYNYQLHERKSFELQLINDRYRHLSIISVLSSILLLVSSIFLLYLVHSGRKKNAYRQKQVELLSELNSRLTKAMQQADGSSTESPHIIQLSKLAEAERELKETFNTRWEETSAYALIMKRIHEENALTKEDWREIETQMQLLDPSFLFKLNTFDLSKIEWQVTILVRLKVVPSKIAQLVCRQKNTISSIRQRLYQKIKSEKGSATDWDKFVQNL